MLEGERDYYVVEIVDPGRRTGPPTASLQAFGADSSDDEVRGPVYLFSCQHWGFVLEHARLCFTHGLCGRCKGFVCFHTRCLCCTLCGRCQGLVCSTQGFCFCQAHSFSFQLDPCRKRVWQWMDSKEPALQEGRECWWRRMACRREAVGERSIGG